MKKYYIAYFIFLLPALIMSLFFKTVSTTSITLQWFFAFFMILSFGVNTASAAYHFPRASFAFILFYTGTNLLIITAFYSAPYDTPFYEFMLRYAGFSSYVPLEIMVKALLDFNIPHEVVVTLTVTGSCLIGYVAGLLHRRVAPDPYAPRIAKDA